MKSALLRSFFSLILMCGPADLIFAQNAQSDLLALSLEDLMELEVYSAAKKAQPLSETAAAIYVITADDIRRSGATNIPEALRMVPGVSVQQIDSNSWDISTRGFNGSIFANKLLVLIDGRAVYTPLFGGVLWDVQDMVLEDIDRIEVIRGPGGTLWGANAVNGVINILTKKAKDTQGGLASVTAGSEVRGVGTLRYGGKTGDWYYRGYGKYFNRDNGYRPDGRNNDDWDMSRGGFKTENEKWTVQGDYYQGNIGQRVRLTQFVSPFVYTNTNDAEVSGWNLLTKYNEEDWYLQMYWDVTNKNLQSFAERRDKIDLEFLRRFYSDERNEISWGLGYRFEHEKPSSTESVLLRKVSEPDQIFSFLVQDEITLSEQWKIIVGTKFEHNIYTGVEVQPNVRTLYKFKDKNLVWAAISRAVRTPSRLDVDGELTSSTNVPTFTRTIGQDVDSEEMIAYEVGYRTQPRENIFLDLAAYSNHYKELVTFDTGPTITDHSFSISTFPAVNGMDGEVHGIELTGDVKLKEWWKITASQAFTKMELHNDSDIFDIGLAKALEDASPRSTAYIRSSFNLPRGFEFDATVRYMDRYSLVKSIIELDLNLTKRVNDWEFALVGQNLVEAHHKESNSTNATQVERGGYVKVTRRF